MNNNYKVKNIVNILLYKESMYWNIFVFLKSLVKIVPTAECSNII